ncbi:unnamed protein product, partial [marine sediment metagenome]
VAEYEELCKKMLNSLYGKFAQKLKDAVNEYKKANKVLEDRLSKATNQRHQAHQEQEGKSYRQH